MFHVALKILATTAFPEKKGYSQKKIEDGQLVFVIKFSYITQGHNSGRTVQIFVLKEHCYKRNKEKKLSTREMIFIRLLFVVHEIGV